MPHATRLILSCEHAVNTIPSTYQPLFANQQDLLMTHRGIDFGALTIANYLGQTDSIPLISAQASRLLIDCNRSLTHPKCFSEVSSVLSTSEKEKIIATYYAPYREKVIELIQEQLKQVQQVIHLSIHSFTPVFDGVERTADLGLLYDPSRKGEKGFAKQWKKTLTKMAPKLAVRMNYPYQGKSDGFTSSLRRLFPESKYIGIEVETNQALLKNNQPTNDYLLLLASSLRSIAD